MFLTIAIDLSLKYKQHIRFLYEIKVSLPLPYERVAQF